MIAALAGIGHGAAAWTIISIDDTSWRRRTSLGSFSIRMNMVGTHWLWVMRCSSMSASARSASKRSITTTVPPDWCMAIENRSGAA